MKNRILILARTGLCAALLTHGIAWAGRFQGTVVTYGKEQCVALARFSQESQARYLPKDASKEQELCAAAFDDKAIGSCPKDLEYQSRQISKIVPGTSTTAGSGTTSIRAVAWNRVPLTRKRVQRWLRSQRRPRSRAVRKH